ncbi:MAG: hypothetical protein ABI771_10635 [Betaproteobacteria bacterium]
MEDVIGDVGDVDYGARIGEACNDEIDAHSTRRLSQGGFDRT